MKENNNLKIPNGEITCMGRCFDLPINGGNTCRGGRLCPPANRGITLVALVVTIIVLIILAGVTLNIALDQNGIIGKSEQGVADYQNASEKEEIEMGGLLNNFVEIETIGKLNSVISDALTNANGDIRLVNENDIQTALNEYDENAQVWKPYHPEYNPHALSAVYFNDTEYIFIARVKGNYYILSKDTLKWSRSYETVIDWRRSCLLLGWNMEWKEESGCIHLRYIDISCMRGRI